MDNQLWALNNYGVALWVGIFQRVAQLEQTQQTLIRYINTQEAKIQRIEKQNVPTLNTKTTSR